MARRSAEPDLCNGKATGLRRSDRFLAGLEDFSRVTFVTHVHPDPDSLGSMLGLAHLVETRLGLPTRLTRDGLISRAENRAMVELLKVDLIPVEEIAWRKDDAVVMVDSQPHTGRHNFDEDLPLYAVIDHHETSGDLDDVAFIDVRPSYGATCTVVTKYLTEQEATIPTRIATALMYGIDTEVTGFPREASETDDSAYQFLYPIADKNLIAEIKSAPLPLSHFECMLQALQNSFIYDHLIISWVNELPQPEQAAEVAEFLIRFEQVDWALCGGVYRDKLVLSFRSAVPQARSGEILRQAVGRMGKAGGHDRRAGGCIRLPSTSMNAIEDVQGELRRRLLKALKIEDCRGQRLVPVREMLQNIQA